MANVAVVGAGWAGCAAAVEATRRGHCVTLFERARILGGRARAVPLHDTLVDNGQHILLGAYTESLRLMQMVGINTKDAFLRLPLQMRYPAGSGGMDFIAPRLPAPFHLLTALLRAQGLTLADKLALARFSSAARWMAWQLHTDCSVIELLERMNQTERLTRLMWRPLCIAALNTAPEQASAQVFLNVLRDSLGAGRAASDMLLPRLDLSALFPQRAAEYVMQAGGKVVTGCTVQQLTPADTSSHDAAKTGWSLQLKADAAAFSQHFDAVIIATDPGRAAELLGTIPTTNPATNAEVDANTDVDTDVDTDADTTAPAFPNFTHEPITTCYLQYDANLRLAQPFFALLDDPEAGHWGQFVFDRGQLIAEQAGLLAVVVSTSAQAITDGQDALASNLTQQLAQALQQPALLTPRWTKVISEKRATFACTPALARPTVQTGWHHLFLAGDYVASDYPATLESAIQSGVAAARIIAA